MLAMAMVVGDVISLNLPAASATSDPRIAATFLCLASGRLPALDSSSDNSIIDIFDEARSQATMKPCGQRAAIQKTAA